MDELQLVPAELAHAELLAPELRAGELAELQAQGFESPIQALVVGVCASDAACTVLDGQRVVAMFGVSPGPIDDGTLIGGARTGAVWFLTGERFPLVARRGLQLARRAVLAMLEMYPVLVTFIDARYEAAIRFAKWLGFTVNAPIPFGPVELPFHPAVIRR